MSPFPKMPEQYRVRHGAMGTEPGCMSHGAFIVPAKPEDDGMLMRIIAAAGMGWEHVSVSFAHRCPTWDEMCWVKSLFWLPEDCVVQYHPPESEYVNEHPYCLHLWRPIGVKLPLPPSIMVGRRQVMSGKAPA